MAGRELNVVSIQHVEGPGLLVMIRQRTRQLPHEDGFVLNARHRELRLKHPLFVASDRFLLLVVHQKQSDEPAGGAFTDNAADVHVAKVRIRLDGLDLAIAERQTNRPTAWGPPPNGRGSVRLVLVLDLLLRVSPPVRIDHDFRSGGIDGKREPKGRGEERYRRTRLLVLTGLAVVGGGVGGLARCLRISRRQHAEDVIVPNLNLARQLLLLAAFGSPEVRNGELLELVS